MSTLKSFKNDQRRNLKPFYILDKAIPAEQRADTLLGVAFTDPRGAVYGGTGFAPQGPLPKKVAAITAKDTVATTTAPVPDTAADTAAGAGAGAANAVVGLGNLLWKTVKGASTSDTLTQTALEVQEEPVNNHVPEIVEPEIPWENQSETKKLYGPWPKDLTDVELYPPNSPIVGSNVSRALEKAREYGLEGKFLDIIKIHADFDQNDESTVTIPIFKRYSMESAYTKVKALFQDPEYRKRAELLLKDLDSKKPRYLWVATDIISCGKLELKSVDNDEKDLGVKAKDPTNTVPITIGGKIRRVKKKTTEGTYESDVIFQMAYIRAEYKVVNEEKRRWGRSPKSPVYDFIVERNYDNDGDTEAWIGKSDSTDGDSIELDLDAVEDEPDIFSDIRYVTETHDIKD
jgi:hypothetical protein